MNSLMASMPDTAIVRGCGTRIAGGVYLEVATAPGGRDLESFLVDPPEPMETDVKVGFEVRHKNGVPCLADHVGEKHYPDAASFLEEGRRFGFSRRVPETFDLSQLTSASRLLIIHPHGLVLNGAERRAYVDDMLRLGVDRSGKAAHHRDHHCGRAAQRQSKQVCGDADLCIRDLWSVPEVSETRVRNLTTGESRVLGGNDILTQDEEVRYLKHFASTRYRVFPAMMDAPEPQTTSALIAVLPLGRLVVVKKDDGSHKDTVDSVKDKLGGTGLHVTEVDA